MSKDLTSFNNLFLVHQEQFICLAFSYINDRMAAEDIVMESLMNYWENRNRLGNNVNMAGYVLTSIKNGCLNYIRDRQKFVCVSDEIKEYKLSFQFDSLQGFDPTELIAKEMMQKINLELKKMPSTTRRIFIKRQFENQSYRQIAVFMNMSVKGVEYHMSKATEHLRASLKDFLPL